MLKRSLFFLSILAVAGQFSGAAHAGSKAAGSDQGLMQHLPAIAGDYFKLQSTSAGRPFHIFVKLPQSYWKDKDQDFPVVFLLDGDSTFPMLSPTHLFLHYDEGIPEAIMVGIAYGGFSTDVNKRHIDFRPRLEDGTVGGAPNFLKMMETELLPRIDKAYRTQTNRRIIFGQSRGGSFVLYAANERPSLFHGYIASNPGREWNKHLYGLNRPPAKKKTDGIVIVTSGTRDRDYLRHGAWEWGALVSSRKDLPWDAELHMIENGTHAASAAQSYRAGLLRIFKRNKKTE